MVEVIKSLQTRGRLPHGLMLVGGTHQSRRLVAMELTKTLVCDQGNACGQCGPCLRITSGQSESLLLVEPDGQNIKLEQAKLILEFFSLASVSKARVVIIDPANLLNQQAANSLLKLVEEPPPHSHILCLTPSSTLMLPTLRSRLQSLRLPFAQEVSSEGEDSEELANVAERGLKGLFEGRRELWSELVDCAKNKETALFLTRALQRKLRTLVVEPATGSSSERSQLMNWWRGLYQIELDILANMDRTLLFENFYYQVKS